MYPRRYVVHAHAGAKILFVAFDTHAKRSLRETQIRGPAHRLTFPLSGGLDFYLHILLFSLQLRDNQFDKY